MFSSEISFITTYVMNPMFLIGYACAVIFPMPILSKTILSIWGSVGSKVMSTATGLFGSSVVNAIETTTGITPATTTVAAPAVAPVATVTAPVAAPVVAPVAAPVASAPVAPTTTTGTTPAA